MFENDIKFNEFFRIRRERFDFLLILIESEMFWVIPFYIESLIITRCLYCERSYDTECSRTDSIKSSSSCDQHTDSEILAQATIALHCFRDKLAVPRRTPVNWKRKWTVGPERQTTISYAELTLNTFRHVKSVESEALLVIKPYGQAHIGYVTSRVGRLAETDSLLFKAKLTYDVTYSR